MIMRNAIAFGAGIVFAIGLGLGGMTQPARIIGLLDVAGRWDPSLVFVLAGAVGTSMLTYRWILRQRHPVLAVRFQIPPVRQIDGRLLLGSGVFGVGWGIGGFCPGPAVTALVSGHPVAIVFVLSMLAGTLLFDYTPLGGLRLSRRKAAGSAGGPPMTTAPTDA
jgi:uncharacterized membrane protein YedE/YeeE